MTKSKVKVSILLIINFINSPLFCWQALTFIYLFVFTTFTVFQLIELFSQVWPLEQILSFLLFSSDYDYQSVVYTCVLSNLRNQMVFICCGKKEIMYQD